MLWTVFWTLLASLLTLGAGLLASPRGRRWLKRQRTRAKQHRRRRAQAAWSAYRVRYRKTRRGSRRESRRSQPPRLTFGHVRSQDDPTVPVKAYRKARDRYQLEKQRSRDRKAMEPKRTMGQRVRVLASQGPWSATKAEVRHRVSSAHGSQCGAKRVDGYRCQNRAMIGDEGHALEFCWIHRNERSSDSNHESRGRHRAESRG